MSARIIAWMFACVMTVSVHGQVLPGRTTMPFAAGFRASRVLSSYPGHIFPSADYWLSAGQRMAQKFTGATPAGIWIVSLYQSNNSTQLNFPSDGSTYPNIQFISTDQNEAYLSRFDSEGFRIWLQVEPGAASMDTLITLVLNRYKHHPCVRGFGVDVEWFFAEANVGGRKVTNAEAAAWETKVRSVDSTYSLFLKHYAPSWMPPSYRGNILFVDDSQDFVSLASMVNEFKAWGTAFGTNDVAFQFGYKIDTTWWAQYTDPPLTIGTALRSAVPNCAGLFWVDFTIMRVFPPTSVPSTEASGPTEFALDQNYPNPFNPSTTISFRTPHAGRVTLELFDLLGRKIALLLDEELLPGHHELGLDGSLLASGIYVYRLRAGADAQARKFILQK